MSRSRSPVGRAPASVADSEELPATQESVHRDMFGDEAILLDDEDSGNSDNEAYQGDPGTSAAQPPAASGDGAKEATSGSN
eukprot:6999602-Pyramimonas_sp.AAC.1